MDRKSGSYKDSSLSFLIVFCLSFQCNAADAWPPTLLNPESLKYVGFVTNFAQMLGMILTYNLFIWFNSKNFCNKYIFSEHHDKGLISNFWMIVALAAFVFIVSFLINFSIREEKPIKQFANFREFIDTISNFRSNPNIRFLIFAVCFMGVGFQPIENGYVVILKKGLSQDALSLVDLTSNVLSTFAGIFGSFLANKKKEFTYILILYGFNTILYSCYFFFIYYFEEIEDDLAFGLFMLEDSLSGMNQSIRLVLYISFILRIADTKISAVYTTFFYSLLGLNNLWTISVSLLLIDYVDYTILCWVGMGFAVIYLLIFGKKIIKMETIEKKCWLVT